MDVGQDIYHLLRKAGVAWQRRIKVTRVVTSLVPDDGTQADVAFTVKTSSGIQPHDIGERIC